MLEALAERTVIIGNSGSGKSTLAEAVASLVHIPVIDLDLLHWEQDGYGVKRNEDVARKWLSMLQTSRAGSSKAHSDGLRRSPFPKQPH